MPRSFLLGDAYEVVTTPLGPTVKEVGSGKLVRYGFGSEEDAKAYCEQLNNRAFIEEEREAQARLDAREERAEFEREQDEYM